MAKTKAQAKDSDDVKKVVGFKKHRRREVQVVSCPSDFPLSSKNANGSSSRHSTRRQQLPNVDSLHQQQSGNNNGRNLLDWRDTAKEIRSFGAAAFEGQQKRNFEDEQYELLTGRKQKKHHVPLPIRMGLKKKAEERQARRMKEAKEAGTVLPKSLSKKQKKEADNTARVHGPAPSVGFMKKGVLRVKPS